MRERFLRILARLAVHRPWTVVFAAVLLAVLSGVYAATSLRLNSDTNDLIACDRPFMVRYRDFIAEFGELEFIYVVVNSHGDHNAASAAIDALLNRLHGLERLQSVHGRIEPLEQLRIATRNMTEQELTEFKRIPDALATLGMVDQNIRASTLLHRANAALDRLPPASTDLDASELERVGSAAVLALNWIASSEPGSAPMLPRPVPQYLRGGHGNLYFLHIDPRKDFSSLAAIAQPLREIRSAIAQVQAEFPQIEIGLTGKPVLQADELATSSHDMTVASITAYLLVAGVFMLAFGGVLRPLMAVIALTCGIAWTFGLATLVIGQLNLLSIVFAIVLVGIGIDFGIHIVARYIEDRQTVGVSESVEHSLLTAGLGNITTAITASSAFFAAMLGDFQGLRELGFIAGSGLLLCLVSMLVVLPALLVLLDRRGEHNRPRARSRNRSLLDRFQYTLSRRAPYTISVVVLVSAAACVALPGLVFEQNLLKLQADNLPSVQWEHRLIEEHVDNVWFGAVVVESIADVSRVLERASQYASFGAVHSVLDVVKGPTPESDAKRRVLHEPNSPLVESVTSNIELSPDAMHHAADLLDGLAALAQLQSPDNAAVLRELADRLQSLAARIKREPEVVGDIEESLALQHENLTTMLAGDRLSLRDALPDAIRNTFTSASGRFLVMINPRENVWEYEPMAKFVADLRSLDPNATGVPMTHFESLNEMLSAFGQAAILALIFVTICVWVDFRGWRDPLLAIIPLCLGLLWLMQIMAVASISFNLANFFAVPILIGNGVSYGVQVLHRHRQTGSGASELGATRLAVILSSFTTMIGFGCMVWASHRGLRSLGLVMTIGSLTCLVAAVLLLPVILAMFKRRTSTHADA
jgi:hypothetical protein